jgi:hypothetical protein
MRFACLALVLCFLAGFPAAAGDVRILTHDNETSTSDCIGNPKTPLCAVETRMACGYYRRKDYCDAVDSDYSHLAGRSASTPDTYAGIADRWYEILKQEVIDETNVCSLQRGLNQPFLLLGDVAVWLHWTSYWPENLCLRQSRDNPRRG